MKLIGVRWIAFDREHDLAIDSKARQEAAFILDFLTPNSTSLPDAVAPAVQAVFNVGPFQPPLSVLG